ncbi:MAG TPA: hypothetical protein VKC60_01090 [Opitutaceae bacterium]|nr:hypothetical protein [Opitutaceae bacterium]
MLRSVAELANLIELFGVSRTYLEAWSASSADERWKEFRPAKVREKIESTQNRPVVSKDIYAALCDAGVHVSPDSARSSHQVGGAVYAGGEFSPMAFLLLLNELAIMLSACLKLTGHLLQASSERIQFLTEAGTKLESEATEWLRITNYRQRLEQAKDHEADL